MSYARKEEDGKDVLIFVADEAKAETIEEHAKIDGPNSSEPLQNGSPESLTDAESTESPEDAYNPETGEINWDCPCIAGMTQPPCGEKFKEAFSCFVYSKSEPKGVDCVEQFREMQSCFQQHPEIYGRDDDEDGADDEGDQDKEDTSKLAEVTDQEKHGDALIPEVDPKHAQSSGTPLS